MKTIKLLLALLLCCAPLAAQINNGGTSSGGQLANTINPTLSPYNAPTSNTCSFSGGLSYSNGSNLVTCTNASFSAADVGKVAWASCCGGNGGQSKTSSVAIIAQGVIHDVVSSTQVHICTTTGTCTAVNATANAAAGAIFYWGFLADTQIASAVSAAYSGPGPCSAIFWTGILMVSHGFGNGPANCIYPIGAVGDTNLSAYGTGRANSIILMEPNFSYTTGSSGSCNGLNTATSTNNICFFGLPGMERKYFGINGGGISNTGSNAVIILAGLTDDFDFDIGLSDVGAQDSAMVCYQMEGSGAYPNFLEVDGCGSQPIYVHSGQTNTLVGGYAADVKGNNTAPGSCGLSVAANAVVTTAQMFFGPCNSGGALQAVGIGSGALWLSTNDTCITGAGTNCFQNNGGEAHLTNFTISTAFSLLPDHGVVSANSASKTYITTSHLYSSINPIFMSGANGTIFLDDKTVLAGGTITGTTPTCAFTTGGGTTPSCSLQTGSTNERGTIIATTGTGAPGTTGTITMTFAGTFSGASAATPDCAFMIDNSGTAWGNEAGAQYQTPSTTAPVVAWYNNVSNVLTALTVSSAYRINYSCTAR